MARGDLIDVGYGQMASPRTMCKSGFVWRYANTSQEAINTNSDIIEIFPYILRTATNYTPYSNDLRNSYVQITIGSTTTTQNLKSKYNFGNVSPTDKKFYLTSEYNSSNPFGYGTPDSQTYVTTRTIDSKTAYGARFTVPHNADGSAPTVSVKWHMTNSSSHSDIEKTASLTLDTIPRASQPTCSNTTLGVSTRINTNRVSNSFTHTLNIKIGSTTIETFTNISEYKDWTPAIANYLSYIPSTSGTATIECITYSNGSEIGRATTSCVLTVPNNNDTKPTLTLTVSKGDNVVPDNWGVYVKGKSKLAISIVGSPKAGTSIASYYSTANGSTYTTSTYTTSELTGSGTVTANVKDGRGFTSNNATASYTVVDYSNPQIYSETTIARCDSNGNITDDGTNALFTFKGKIESINNNNAKYFSLSYKEKSAGSYTFIKGWETFELSTQAVNEIAKINNVPINLDITKEYVFRFEAIDNFTTTAKEVEVGTVADLMNFNPSGKSMAFGGISTRGATESVIDFKTTTTQFKDVIVENIRSKNMAMINKITLNFNYYYEDIIICNISNLKSNTQYTLSYDIQNAVEPFNLKIGYGNNYFDEDLAIKENNNNGHIIFSFSTGTLPQKQYLYFRPCSYNSSTQVSNCVVSNIQLEEGSTATTYTPYQELNPDNFKNEEIVVGSIRSKNMYNVNSTYVGGVNNQNINNKINLKPNKNYYFRTGKTYTEIKLYDSGNNQTRSLGGNADTTEIGFTTASNEVKGEFIFYSGQNNVDLSTYDFTNVQLEEGSTPTGYIPYQNLNGMETYSSSEQVIGKWVNGKTLYRQTFGYDNVPINQETNFTWNGSSWNNNVSNIDEVVNYKAFYHRYDNNNYFNAYEPVPTIHSDMSNWGSGAYDFNSIGFKFWVGTLYSAFQVKLLVVTIEYTKTTD